MFDYFLRSLSFGNVWYSFWNCYCEFLILYFDICILQNYRMVFWFLYLKDRLEKNYWKYEIKFILDVIIILLKKYILKIKYFVDKFYFFVYFLYFLYLGDIYNFFIL